MATQLNKAKLRQLKAAISAETDADFVGYRTNGQTGLMADWLNGEKAPPVQCWRKNVQPQETDAATPWTGFDTIYTANPGKGNSFLHAFLRYPRDYTEGQTVRKWITDVWGNATVGSAAETILRGAGLRNVTRAEAVLGGSTQASTNSVSAIKLSWEGPLSTEDVDAALIAV